MRARQELHEERRECGQLREQRRRVRPGALHALLEQVHAAKRAREQAAFGSAVDQTLHKQSTSTSALQVGECSSARM